MAYRCEATSVAGFVQQLAVAYVAHGYYSYASGWIPDHEDSVETDEKIIAQYNLDLSRWARCTRHWPGISTIPTRPPGNWPPNTETSTSGNKRTQRHRFWPDSKPNPCPDGGRSLR